jgi:hypothetical protein
MRYLLIVVVLLLVPRVALAEDTAAVLTAMPNKAAEQRYLKALCDDAEIYFGLHLKALGGPANVAVYTEEQWEPFSARYEMAERAYEAKRGATAPRCWSAKPWAYVRGGALLKGEPDPKDQPTPAVKRKK